MKAIVWTAYGPPSVLQLREVPQPVPKDNEVLIRIHAATVSAGDCEMRALSLPGPFSLPWRLYAGVRKPTRLTILGQELAGEVEAVGQTVTRFKVGDQVFGTSGLRMSTYAEYIALRENAPLAIKPTNMTYDEAATLPVGGMTALHFLRQAAIRPGQKVLINGAGGSIGTIAVQLAKNDGAEVTAVDSADKLDMLRGIGADHVIDYARQDFTRNGETYDVIMDVVGKSQFAASMASLADNGFYLLANPSMSHMLRGRLSGSGGRTVISDQPGDGSELLNAIRKLVEAGQLRTVIDRRYPLAETAEAHRYVESGRKAGNVVIVVE